MSPLACLRDRGGALLAEVALMLSVLTTLALGGVEVGRFVLLNQKLERVAATVGDLVAQAQTLSDADISSIFDAVRSVATPFPFADNGVAIVSSISATGNAPPAITWQRVGGGSNGIGSRVGVSGGALALPSGFTVTPGETLIVAEVNYRYTPWIFPDLIGPADLYHSAFLRARYGALTALE